MPEAVTGQAGPGLLEQRPLRLHHHAFNTADQEKNRQFLEDIIGIPLVATWTERKFRKEMGREVDYCHTFFELEDGSALAFFQWADPEAHEKNAPIFHPSGGGSWHLALKTTEKTQAEIEARLKAAGVHHWRTDHGYCKSLYCHTPDRLRLEFTVDAPNVEAINAMRRKDAHSELARWIAGDYTPNNEDRAL